MPRGFPKKDHPEKYSKKPVERQLKEVKAHTPMIHHTKSIEPTITMPVRELASLLAWSIAKAIKEMKD